jgi:CBS domain-containing protein
MDRDCPTVEGHLSLQDFVHEYLSRSGHRCFAVVQNGHLSGLVTPNEVEHVDRERWAQTSVQAMMRPVSQLRTIAPDTPAIQALEIMSREDINQLPVLSDGRLEGLFSRRHILDFLQNHAELNRR